MADRPLVEATPYRGPAWAFDMSGWPLHWLHKAQELDRAAATLLDAFNRDIAALRAYVVEMRQNPDARLECPRIASLDVYFFLAALALENVLKGLFVRAHPECIEDGKLRGDVITSHNLECLAQEIGVPLSDEERLLLEHGRDAIESWGRYPLPKNVGEWDAQRSVDSRIADVYANLFGRLCNDLQSEPRPRHGAP